MLDALFIASDRIVGGLGEAFAMRHAQILVAMLFAAGTTAIAQEKPVEIPLTEIWAYKMLGTRDVRELESVPKGLPNDELFRRSLVYQIHRARHKARPKEGASGFAVSGTAQEALK